MFAVKAHAGTERRGKGFPYIVHPMEAMEIVATMTPDQELLAAAALHDTVEDTDVTIEQIRAEFGERIAALVEAESDEVVEGVREEDSWHQRKQAAIDRSATAPEGKMARGSPSRIFSRAAFTPLMLVEVAPALVPNVGFTEMKLGVRPLIHMRNSFTMT